MKTTPTKPIITSSGIIPVTIHSTCNDDDRVNPFARELIADGWMLISTKKKNFLVLLDWCEDHLDHSEFAYNQNMNIFIFKHTADAVQFKLACLID